MGYPRRLLTEGEDVLEEMNPHWKALLPGLLVLAVGAAAVVAVLVLVEDSRAVWVALAMGVIAIAAALPGFFRWRYTQYILTNERIIARWGFISRSSTEIPLDRINNVIFSQNVGERLLRYGDVVIESAGSQGQTRLDDIADPEAFQSRILNARDEHGRSVAGTGSGEQAAESSGGDSRDPVARLQALGELHEKGQLSDAEFEEQKARLLDQM